MLGSKKASRRTHVAIGAKKEALSLSDSRKSILKSYLGNNPGGGASVGQSAQRMPTLGSTSKGSDNS